MKPIVVTLTLKRLLIFGLPILAFMIFVFVGLNYKADTLTEEKEILEQDFALFKNHSIIFTAEFHKVLEDSQEEYAFTAWAERKNERIGYVCSSTVNIPRAKQKIAFHRQRVASGEKKNLVISGRPERNPITRTKTGDRVMFVANCVIF